MKAANANSGLTPVKAITALYRDQRLEGFDPRYRRFIRDLTDCSPALEDLADSFPALLFALATGYATPDRRQHAIKLIHAGAPLKAVTESLELPWWLRRLPPQAFSAPLPPLPTSADFTFRIASAIPPEAQHAQSWFARVCYALEAGGPAFALWTVRQPDATTPPDDTLVLMAAWAWFSERPGLTGHRLLRRPWDVDMSAKRAREELAAWQQRLRLLEWLGSGIETPWLADGNASGFTFVALRTVDDFIAESRALDNCLDQYAEQLRTGLTAVFSIRKGARRVACVEIGLHDEDVTMPTIVQLRATRNRRAAPDVWRATFGWLGSQRLEPLFPERHTPKAGKRAAAIRRLWAPYLVFLRGSMHLPAFKRAIYGRRRAVSQSGAGPILRRRRAPPPRLAQMPDGAYPERR